MGELHLEVLVDRMKREFKVEANVGKPQVAYRETLTKKVDRSTTPTRSRPVDPVSSPRSQLQSSQTLLKAAATCLRTRSPVVVFPREYIPPWMRLPREHAARCSGRLPHG